jgi:hypothetical protein
MTQRKFPTRVEIVGPGMEEFCGVAKTEVSGLELVVGCIIVRADLNPKSKSTVSQYFFFT